MYYVYWEDHYEPGTVCSEFEDLEDALNKVLRVEDEGGTAVCIDEDGNAHNPD